MSVAATQSRYRVQGMDCPSCALKIETAVMRVDGVQEVAISAPAGTMRIAHVDRPEIRPSVERRVAGLGYRLQLVPPSWADPEQAPHGRLDDRNSADPIWWRQRRTVLTVAAACALAVAIGVARLAPQTGPYLFILVMLIGQAPIARRAFAAAAAGSPFSIEMLMTIAAVGAVAIGAVEEAATVVFLFMVGELLEGFTAARARSSIEALSDLVPATARIEQPDGTIGEMPADRVAVGSVVQVRPGDRIAADGIILSGTGGIDEAPVTGESVPKTKGPGEPVFAGTINVDAVLRVEVSAAAADNTIARIVRLVEDAQANKAPTERFINRFVRIYTPCVVAIAAAIAVVPPLFAGESWEAWIYKGLAILLIGCPCALVISTPVAIAASLAAGARHGLLVKGGNVLEQLGRIDTIAFDKTGTLTQGKPSITNVLGFKLEPENVLRQAAALEGGSSHPLAKAIVEHAAGLDLPVVEGARALGGKGVLGAIGGVGLFFGSPRTVTSALRMGDAVTAKIEALEAEGKTVAVLARDDTVLGAIALRDVPRPDARAGLSALRKAGIEVIMLTGDHRRTAAAIGAELGIEARGEMLPDDKRRAVIELQEAGRIVAKVGDGINDAPALATADVGIAMGSGTDVALETADAAVLHARIGDVAGLVALSRRTMANIRQNITIALGLKALFLATTVLGITGLWPAILADTGATVLVTANAMRLLSRRGAY